jgi:hypothetical protein
MRYYSRCPRTHDVDSRTRNSEIGQVDLAHTAGQLRDSRGLQNADHIRRTQRRYLVVESGNHSALRLLRIDLTEVAPLDLCLSDPAEALMSSP